MALVKKVLANGEVVLVDTTTIVRPQRYNADGGMIVENIGDERNRIVGSAAGGPQVEFASPDED